MKLAISVIIPILNSAHLIKKNRTHIQKLAAIVEEIIFVDGFSHDDTISQINDLQLDNDQVVQTQQGRGKQLFKGAKQAKWSWLLFMHIDSYFLHSQAEIFDTLQIYLNQETIQPIYFTLKFDDDAKLARLIEKRIAWRNRRFNLPYGDQGLLIGRECYQQIGGYNTAYPIMEDVDLVFKIQQYYKQRNEKVPLIKSELVMQTSAEKYLKKGYYKRIMLNLICLSLFLLKLHPKYILKLYRL